MKRLLYLFPILLFIGSCSDEIPIPVIENVLTNKTGHGLSLETYIYTDLGKMDTVFFTPGYIEKDDSYILKFQTENPNRGLLTDIDSLVIIFDDGKVLTIECDWNKPNNIDKFWCNWDKSPLNSLAYKNEKLNDQLGRSTFVFTDSLYFLAK